MTRTTGLVGRAALGAVTLMLLQAHVCGPVGPEPPPVTITGTLTCNGAPAADVPVIPNGGGLVLTDAAGTFTFTGSVPGTPNGLRVLYEATVPVTPSIAVPMKIGDDVMIARHDDLAATPAVNGASIAFGTLAIPGTDCQLWASGVRALRHFAAVTNAAPPGGGLHFKRWSNVPLSVGAPHTFFDLIVVPTDTMTQQPGVIFHEFGHRIRHAADGPQTHWDWDNTRFIYARTHGGAETFNRGYTFNEGWANYWSMAFFGGPGTPATCPASDASDPFMDFNELRVGARLFALACPVGHAFMVQLLLDNPGALHTLPQFEAAYCAAVGTNAFCSVGAPLRTFASCPPGWNDDGLTCRFVTDFAKNWFYRGPGQIPPIGGGCAAGTENWLGLCYPLCQAPFVSAGTNCVQPCPPDFSDTGATCHRAPLSDPLQNIFSDDPVVAP